MRVTRPGILAATFASCTAQAQPVRVVLDMDAVRPGIQNSITVGAGTTVIPGLAVYIYDRKGAHSIRGIGYLGGLDRGLAIGHTPTNGNTGSVTGFTGHIGTPICESSYLTDLVQKGFSGPELHYLEYGTSMRPIPSTPLEPVFTIDVHLSSSALGDDFHIYLLDMVRVWSGFGGAFSALPAGVGLDTGGDCTPDGTATLEGVDPDPALPAPPAAFLVDLIDGQGGGRIIVAQGTCYADCDNSWGTPQLTANDFQCFINRFAAGHPYANCDGSTTTPKLTANDFQCFIDKYAAGCN